MAQIHDSEELKRLREVVRGKRRRHVSGGCEVIPFGAKSAEGARSHAVDESPSASPRLLPEVFVFAARGAPPPQFMPEQFRQELVVVQLQLDAVIRLGLPQIEAHRSELEKILALVKKQSDNSSKAIPMLQEQIKLVATFTSAVRQCGI